MWEELFAEYKEYRKRDKHPLLWDIWLKHKKKAKVNNENKKNIMAEQKRFQCNL